MAGCSGKGKRGGSKGDFARVLVLLASYFFFLPCVEPMVRRRQGGRLSKEEKAALRRGLICSGTLLGHGGVYGTERDICGIGKNQKLNNQEVNPWLLIFPTTNGIWRTSSPGDHLPDGGG